MIDLDPESLATVKRILVAQVPGVEVRVFGSRVLGTARKFSDLDLALVCPRPLDRGRIEALKDAFSESNLSIQVDVLDWNRLSDEFRSVIARRFEVL